MILIQKTKEILFNKMMLKKIILIYLSKRILIQTIFVNSKTLIVAFRLELLKEEMIFHHKFTILLSSPLQV